MKVIRLSVLRTGRLYPLEISPLFSSVRGRVDPRVIVRPDTTGNRTRDLLVCSVVSQTIAPPRTPPSMWVKRIDVTMDWVTACTGKQEMCLLSPVSKATWHSPLENRGQFNSFRGNHRYVAVCTTTSRMFLYSATLIQSTPSHPISSWSILTASFHSHLGIPSGLFPSVIPNIHTCVR